MTAANSEATVATGPSIDAKGQFVALGSTSFVERLPDGSILKRPSPALDRASERRDELRLESEIYDRLGESSLIVKKLGWDDKDCALRLEYMSNGTLREYIKSHQEVSNNQRQKWSMEAAQGLQLLHQAGVVHCDVGPHNYLLGQDLQLKITDFAGSSLDGSSTNIRPGSRYKAPRTSKNAPGNPTIHDDIFALGSTIYFIMEGKAPFEEFESEKVQNKFQDNQFPDIGATPCAKIIRDCWLGEFSCVEKVIEAINELSTS
ncbi:Serine threonine protein kinase [Fusarium austroafricanum]|uniref:Serine threonine protein kinase n=1 Tax=Fusarium austroafricanum TaxID=2364996 RepID=A0A8H4NZ56_9HYPO|nr:Serine threonine protein kinase [Fusarium austroafricanum]